MVGSNLSEAEYLSPVLATDTGRCHFERGADRPTHHGDPDRPRAQGL